MLIGRILFGYIGPFVRSDRGNGPNAWECAVLRAVHSKTAERMARKPQGGESMTTEGILKAEHAEILEQERAVLTALRDIAAGLDPGSDPARHAGSIVEHLDELFLLVVVGEVKSGKSAFINSILGEKVCPEGPTPVTDRINVLTFGEESRERMLDEFVIERLFPIEILRNLCVVDTPGTNSIVLRHQEITEDYIPRADLILFVTSIDRPFSETERQFLTYISSRWRKNIVVFLTKIDTREEDEIKEVEAYLAKNFKEKLGIEPLIFPVSAKQAFRAKSEGDDALLEQSRLRAVERFIRERLTETEKLRLKLLSPVDAGLAVAETLDGVVAERRRVLEEDFQSLGTLDRQVEQTCEDLKERNHRFITEIYDILREFERRGKNFLEEKIRVGNIGLMRKPEKFQNLFEKEVVGDLRERVSDTMHSAVDWLMKESIALYERTAAFLTERVQKDKYRDKVLGGTDLAFDYNREQVFSLVRAGFEREVKEFDIPGECNRVLSSSYRSILGFFGVEIGAVALGALLTHIFSAIVLVVSGILLASVLALTGFFILPAKKRRAIAEFSRKVDTLTLEFRKTISREFEKEINGALEKIRTGYEPYMTFYKAESKKAETAEKDLKSCRTTLGALKKKLLPE